MASKLTLAVRIQIFAQNGQEARTRSSRSIECPATERREIADDVDELDHGEH